MTSSEVRSDKIQTSICQLTSTDSPEFNLDQIVQMTEEASLLGSSLVAFPENSLYMRIEEKDPPFGFELDWEGFDKLARLARRLKITIYLGSVPMTGKDGVLNSTLVIDSSGKVSCPYNKIHLFDIELKGQKPVRESDHFIAGGEPGYMYVDGWKIGLAICYDLRFPELFLHYAFEEVDALMVPAAFLKKTGQAHWEALLRARAIECQAYVLAPAQWGGHLGREGGRRETYGHSMIVDPWGRISEEIGEGIGMIHTSLSRDEIVRVREQIPIKDHRRLSSWSRS